MAKEKIALDSSGVCTADRNVIKKAVKPPRGLAIAACAAVAAVLSVASTGFADISGFGDGAGFTLTGYTQDSSGNITDNNAPAINSGTLTLTSAAAGEARAAFFNTLQSISHFTVGFTFQTDPTSFAPLGPSDGFAFVLQNDSRGTLAIGGGGAGLGYGLMNNNQPPSGSPVLTAITPSAAAEFFLRNGNGAVSTENSGTIDPNSGITTGSVSLVSGDPIGVVLSYNGTTLTETLTDLNNPSEVFAASTSAINLPQILGGDSAFVGFTGGTGGGYSTQTISNFTYSSTVPEPSALAIMAVAGTGILLLRKRQADSQSI